jgi:hypothetical protein
MISSAFGDSLTAAAYAKLDDGSLALTHNIEIL